MDVAVAQPSLPVPSDGNSRRTHMNQSAESQQQSLPPPRDRYPAYLHPVEVAAMQQQHQVTDLKYFKLFKQKINIFFFIIIDGNIPPSTTQSRDSRIQ